MKKTYEHPPLEVFTFNIRFTKLDIRYYLTNRALVKIHPEYSYVGLLNRSIPFNLNLYYANIYSHYFNHRLQNEIEIK
jgi:hypothetical protein